MMTRIFGIIIATIVCLGAGFLGSLATMPSIPTWYVALNKPPFNRVFFNYRKPLADSHFWRHLCFYVFPPDVSLF